MHLNKINSIKFYNTNKLNYVYLKKKENASIPEYKPLKPRFSYWVLLNIKIKPFDLKWREISSKYRLIEGFRWSYHLHIKPLNTILLLFTRTDHNKIK